MSAEAYKRAAGMVRELGADLARLSCPSTELVHNLATRLDALASGQARGAGKPMTCGHSFSDSWVFEDEESGQGYCGRCRNPQPPAQREAVAWGCTKEQLPIALDPRGKPAAHFHHPVWPGTGSYRAVACDGQLEPLFASPPETIPVEVAQALADRLRFAMQHRGASSGEDRAALEAFDKARGGV